MPKDDSGRNTLHLAAKDIKKLQNIINKNPEFINKPDNLGVLPIHLVAAEGTPESLKLLTDKGASLSCKSNSGKTPLHYAAMSDNYTNIEWIASHGVDLDIIDNKLDSTPLILAAMLSNVTSTISLIKLGCKVNVQDRLGSTALHYAARNNQRELASLLLKQGLETDIKDIHGCTCLHYAATNGNAEIVRLLISARANLMALTREGHIPMHLAAGGGHVNVLKEFLTAKVPYNYCSPKNNGTALYYAALSGNEEIIRVLVKLGSDLFHQCNGRQTPLHAAASRGHLSCVKILLELGSNVTVTDDSGQIPLHKSAKYGHKECVEFLQRKAPHTIRYRDNTGYTAMGIAAISKHCECMELLLEKEATSLKWTDREGRTQLHWAAAAGHSTLVRELLKGITCETTDNSGRTALHWAVSGGNGETVRVLLEHGASIVNVCKKDNCNAIHYAAMKGATTILQMMFGARNVPEVNTANSMGSPLYFAAYGHSDTIKFLIERGADINYIGPKNNTIFHRAVRGGCDLDIIKLLENKGLSDIKPNVFGETSFHYAACLEDTTLLNYFLQSNGKQKINLLTKKNNSPLHYAANFGILEAIEILIKHGANKSQKNSKNETPYDIAEKRNHTECLSILK